MDKEIMAARLVMIAARILLKDENVVQELSSISGGLSIDYESELALVLKKRAQDEK